MKSIFALAILALLTSCTAQEQKSQDLAFNTIKFEYISKQYKHPKNQIIVKDVKLIQSYTVGDSLSILASNLIPLFTKSGDGFKFSIQNKQLFDNDISKLNNEIEKAEQQSRKDYLENKKRRSIQGLKVTEEWISILKKGMNGEIIRKDTWSESLKLRWNNSFDMKHLVNKLNTYNRLNQLPTTTIIGQLYYAAIQYQSTSKQIVYSVGEHLLSIDNGKYIARINDFDPNYDTYIHSVPEYSYTELDMLFREYTEK